MLNIILIFFVPANIILLLLLKFNKEKAINNYIQLVISYGVAPLISALIFRYLILLFPEKNNLFYILIVYSFWVTLLLLFFKNISQLKIAYKELYSFVKKNIFSKDLLIYLPIIFIFLFFTFQTLAYPIVSGDSSRYINQSKALYTYKNIQWEKEKTVIINGNDEYKYNSMIRPAIPYFMALTFIAGGNSNNYFMYRFLVFYYYLLLYLIFIVLIYTLADKLKKNKKQAIFFGTLFFTFFWGLTRTMVFSSKESAIYFFTLLGIYLVYKLVSLKQRNIFLEILLGIILGLNSFINLHGIIVGLILIFLLFIFSNLKFWERIRQFFVVFFVYLFFGAFELVINFKGMLLSVFAKINDFIFTQKDAEISDIAQKESVVRSGHLNLYQTKNIWDIYLKGKFQIVTNVGVFGFYFWFFLIILFGKFKKIISSRAGKLITSFIVIYFLLFMDPFNIDSSPFAVILWGSTKYAKLILLISLIITAVYFKDYIQKLFLYMKKFKYRMLFFLVGLLLVGIVFKNVINAFALKILLVTIPVFKNITFYEGKIQLFYICMMMFVVLILVSLMLVFLNRIKKASDVFLATFILFFIISPFFITNVGKVPLDRTFTYLYLNRELKMKNILNKEGLYDVYFQAKKILPRNTLIKTNNDELYIYDNYFKLTKYNDKNLDYEITKKCKFDWKKIYSNKKFKLCKKL